MTGKWRKILRRYVSDQTGATMIYAAITFPVFISGVALATDISMIYATQNRLQSAADAAVLAAVNEIGDRQAVIDKARQYARENIPDRDGTTVLRAQDVLIGHWDGDVFVNGASPENAVQVTTRRSDINSNALPAIFGTFLGHNSFNVSAQSVALLSGGTEDCFTQGLVAQGIVEFGSTNDFENFCIHGQRGIKISSDNVFEDASSVSLRNLNDVEASSPNPGFNDAVFERDLPPADALDIVNILNDLENGRGELPDFLSGVVIRRRSLPRRPTPGVLYIVNQDIDLKGRISGFGVYSSKKITVSSDARLDNVLLASEEDIETGSNVDIGNRNFCATGEGQVIFAARGEVNLGSNVSFGGAQIIAGRSIEAGSNLTNLSGLGAQSGGDIKIGSENQSECGEPNNVLFSGDGGGSSFRLVN